MKKGLATQPVHITCMLPRGAARFGTTSRTPAVVVVSVVLACGRGVELEGVLQIEDRVYFLVAAVPRECFVYSQDSGNSILLIACTLRCRR